MKFSTSILRNTEYSRITLQHLSPLPTLNIFTKKAIFFFVICDKVTIGVFFERCNAKTPGRRDKGTGVFLQKHEL